jgi:hypothetical protein
MSWDTCEGFTNICRASKGGDGGLWQVDVIRRDMLNRTLASPATWPFARTFVLPIALVKQRLSA